MKGSSTATLFIILALTSFSANAQSDPSTPKASFDISTYPYAVSVGTNNGNSVNLAIGLFTNLTFFNINENSSIFALTECYSEEDSDAGTDGCVYDSSNEVEYDWTTFSFSGYSSNQTAQLQDGNITTSWIVDSSYKPVAAASINGQLASMPQGKIAGGIGLGISGNALQNFEYASNFMLSLDSSSQTGQLIINQPSLPQNDLLASLTPFDKNWHVGIKFLTIDKDYSPIDTDQLVFDVTIPYIALPVDYYNKIYDAIVRVNIIECSDNHVDTPLIGVVKSCHFVKNSDITELPNIYIYTASQQYITIPPEVYFQQVNGSSSNYQLMITPTNVDDSDQYTLTVTKEYASSIIIGSAFFEKYNVLFDFGQPTNPRIYIYDPSANTERWTLFAFVTVGVVLLVGVMTVLCCMKGPKFRRDSEIVKAAKQSYYQPPDFVLLNNSEQDANKYVSRLSVISEKDDESGSVLARPSNLAPK